MSTRNTDAQDRHQHEFASVYTHTHNIPGTLGLHDKKRSINDAADCLPACFKPTSSSPKSCRTHFCARTSTDSGLCFDSYLAK